MTMIKTALAATALAFALSTGAFADPAATSTTTPPATTTKTAKVKTPAKPRSAESIECSKQADAKGLHGKPRKEFRASCMKAAKPAAKTN